jgi:hypothetical protein
MTKKDICLVTLVAVLGGWYAFHFTDWFRHKVIRIEHTVRALPEPGPAYGRPADPTGKDVEKVAFSFRKHYRLTSVKLVLAAEIQTNKYAHPLWELVSPKGSQPVNGIVYGNPIPGMASAVPAADAEPLEPGVEYRLLVEARSLKGTNDFNVPARSASRR